jgi:hypothetical protein
MAHHKLTWVVAISAATVLAVSGGAATAAGGAAATEVATATEAAAAGGAEAAPATGAAPAAPPGVLAPLLWAGNPSLGPARNFDGLERDPGTITVASDPQGRFGASFRFETFDWANGKERCESRGLRRPDGSVLRINNSMQGQTLYLGWRALWQPMPTTRGRWISLFQLHISGRSPGEPGAGPYVLRTLGDGMLHFQYVTPNGTSRHIWNAPLRVGQWQTFVIAFRVSRGADGWTSFWYNGAQQRFTDGSTQFRGPTLMGTHVNVKWGVYRSGPNSGRAVAWVNQPRLGTTLGDVLPTL